MLAPEKEVSLALYVFNSAFFQEGTLVESVGFLELVEDVSSSNLWLVSLLMVLNCGFQTAIPSQLMLLDRLEGFPAVFG